MVGPSTPGFICYHRAENDRRSLTLAREQWSDPARRELYLLRTVEQPISLDRNVLPFATEREVGTIQLVAAVLSIPEMKDEAIMKNLGEPIAGLPGGAATWTFAGFDVCDLYGTSGLTNCAYESEEASLATAWHDRLNRYHLLDDLEAATEFREVTDLRVAEHKPFLVHGIFCRGLTW